MAATHHIRSHVPMFTIIFIALAAIVVVLLIVVAMQPSEFRVVRAIVISASPPPVFAHIFTPDGKQTVVMWSMSGTNHFLSKAVHLVMNMDKMVGGRFEKGLANMKSVLETAPEP